MLKLENAGLNLGVSVSKLGGVPRQSSFLGEGEADGGKTEDLGMSWEASSGWVEQSGL